jgi:DNA-binding SARP family transcriptional activator
MEFRILGPVEVADRGSPVELGGPLERALLVRLLIDAGRTVSVDRLVEDLWAGDPPGSAINSIRVRVSRLRKAFAGDGINRLHTQPPGYRFAPTEDDLLDVRQFEERTEQGRAALRDGNADMAAQLLREALALWRGPALAGVGEAPYARSEAIRLEEGALGTLEHRIDADLALGRHLGLVGELEALCSRHPLRERFWAQRMIALYRSGRQADALSVFQDLRTKLSNELGLDPSPDLTALEAQVLAQAPELALAPPPRIEGGGLPSGVVTFLLTDIEGSTELWESNPAEMAHILERHDRLIEHIVATHGGHLIKSKGEGDATLSVFRRATGAAAAAVDLSRAIAAEKWRGDVALRVRVAIHTGEAHERDGDYFGPALNRAARIRALAAGDQLLLSEIVAGLVRDALPSGASLVDLGEKSLRGLSRAEHVFELVHGDRDPFAAPREAPLAARPPLPDALGIAVGGQFVGRESEIQRLVTLLKEVVDGGLRTVFAAGEPGIGKTRICAEFARLAYEDGAVVLYGRSDEEPLVAYQPFVEALRRWSAALSATERAALSGAEYLAPLMGSNTPAAGHPATEDAEVARYKFFEAVASALEQAALAGPVLFVLDDLHWADRPTLQLLQHVLRTRARSPLLVLGTYRETDLTRTRPLAEALVDFRRERAFERIALHGLAEEEIVVLLQDTASHEIGGAGRALARALSETTEGNPFFIEQILGNLVDTGHLVLQDGRWSLDARIEDLGIPEGIVEAIGRRLSRLSESCNKTLAAASVLGRDFEMDILTRVVDRDADDVLAAVEEALHVGLVREVPARAHAACTFSHALVQQALYEEISLARKQRLHLKAAAAIEAAHANDIDPYVTSLARHLRAAGAAADPDKAIDFSIRAMDAANRVFAFDEGITHGEAALELIDEYGTAEDRRAHLDERLGDMHYVAGVEYGRSFAHFEKALQAQTALGDTTRIARLRIKLGRGQATYLDTGDINNALEHLRAAEQILGPDPEPRLAGPLSLGLAGASTYHHDIGAGSAAATSAMEIGREQSSESIWATGAAFKGWTLAIAGQYDTALDLLEEAWTVADRLDNVLAAFGAAWIRCQGYWTEPVEHGRLALIELNKPRQAQATNARRMLRITSAGALAAAGQAAEARALLGELGLPFVLGGPGMRYLAGSFEEYDRFATEQLDELHGRGHDLIALMTRIHGQGPIQWAAGRTDDARATIVSTLGRIDSQSAGLCFDAHVMLGLLEAEAGNLTAAAEHLSTCDDILASGNGWRGSLGALARAKGAAAAAVASDSEADALFTEAADTHRVNGLPFEEAESLLAWGRALQRRNPKGAAEKCESAIELYKRGDVGQAWLDRALAQRRNI